jgi:hypothetical protein
MSGKINSILVIGIFVLILSGCAASRIPSEYRFSPRGLKHEISGNWADLKPHSADITNPLKTLSGELIAIQSDSIYILTSGGLAVFHLSAIDETVVYMFTNQAAGMAVFTGLLFIPDVIAAITIGEPGFLIIGAPWLLTGSILTVVESTNHSNLLNYPYSNRLEDLRKFSRFPQGMPPGIDRSRIHLIKRNS